MLFRQLPVLTYYVYDKLIMISSHMHLRYTLITINACIINLLSTIHVWNRPDISIKT